MLPVKKTITYKRILDRRFFLNKPNTSFINNFINGRQYFYSTSGRSGLLRLIDILGIEDGEEVLLPAYSPEGLLLPFKKRRIKLRYYSLDENLNPDLLDIERIIKVFSIKLIVVIHYFGLKKNIEGVMNLVNINIPVLEDCAQAFLAKDKNGIFFGQKGDIAIFSFPKFLPIPDGGLIVFNNNTLNDTSIKHNQRGLSIALARIAAELSIILKSLQVKKPWAKLLQLPSIFFHMVYYYILCSLNKSYTISRFSYTRLITFNYNEISSRRLTNINYYKTRLSDFDIGTNAPGFVIKTTDREILQKKLKAEGIESLIYRKKWFYFGKPLKYCAISKESFISTHILIPINENYDPGDLKMVLDTVINWINK